MTAPVTAVFAEIQTGVASVPDLAARTGLSPDLVRAVVDRLVRAGRVKPWTRTDCAPAGCSECIVSGCPISSLPRR